MLSVNLFNPSGHQPSSLNPGFWQQTEKPALDTTAGDRFTRDSESFARVQSLLNQRLSNVLTPAQSTVATKGQEGAFDVESLASNILGWVQNRLNQAKAEGADQSQLDTLREQAKQGIEQGIKDAREVLKGLDRLSETVTSGIDRLQELLFQGLEDTPSKDTKSAQAQRIEAVQGYQQNSETSFELEIRTRDGDKLKLHFQQSDSRQDLFAYLADETGQAYALKHSESFTMRYAFSVEGELDEAELTAITDLASNLQQLSDTFFAGDALAALEQGLQLGFDTTQIAGFAFELQQSQSSSQIARYRQIDALETEHRPQIPGLNQLGDLLGELNGLLQQMRTVVEDAEQVTKDMFGGFVSRHQKAGEFSHRVQAEDLEGLKKLADSLVEQAGRKEQIPDIGAVERKAQSESIKAL
jgi:hypothetical protein